MVMSGPAIELEWAQIDAWHAVVASPQTAWLHRLQPLDDPLPFSRPMQGAGRAETTARLLQGCLAAASWLQPMARESPPSGRSATLAWAWWLIGSYHCAHPAPALLRRAAERFALAGRRELAAYVRHQAEEETGHDELARLDLEALGYRAQALVDTCCPSKAQALVAHFTACVESETPVRVLGYVHALELWSLRVDAAAIAALERMLPAGVDATRCLRVHSSIGYEPAHVREAAAFIATLRAEERTLVAQTCFATGVLLRAPYDDDRPAEDWLAARLAPFTLP